MWIFTSNSFLSVVADRNHPGRLLVRARVKGDIERAFSDVGADFVPEVMETKNADYLYRASIPREVIGLVVAASVDAITYDNFKNSVDEGDRHDSLMDCWSAMVRLQTRRSRRI